MYLLTEHSYLAVANQIARLHKNTLFRLGCALHYIVTCLLRLEPFQPDMQYDLENQDRCGRQQVEE